MKQRRKVSSNVILCGPTGVGKSAIVNKVLRERAAITGVGRPVSKQIIQYIKKGIPINLFDTPGFEIGNEDVMDDVLEFIWSCQKSRDHSEHLHIMWYCVSGSNSRFQKSEIEFLKSTTEYLSTIIVVTKTDQDVNESNKLSTHISRKKLRIENILKTSTKTGLNIDKLISLTRRLTPDT